MFHKFRFYLLIIVILCASKNTLAQFPFTESFKNSTVPNLFFGGTPHAKLTAGSEDPEGDGYLRLTNADGGQTGYVYSTVKFPSSKGFTVDFEYYTYGGDINYGADGITFFLFDAAVDSFNIGAFGGALGYAQRVDEIKKIAGVSKGYLGVGLDEWGNFSSPDEGRQGGIGRRLNSVTLRGAGNGLAQTPDNYPYLTSKQTTPLFEIAGGKRTATSSANDGFRKAIIELKPKSGGGYLVTVKIQLTASGTTNTVTVIDNYEYNTVAPPYLRFGFASSTGGGTNFHEIRNLHFNLPADAVVIPPIANNDSFTINQNDLSGSVLKDIVNNDINNNAGSGLDTLSIDLDPSTPGIQTSKFVTGKGTFSVNTKGQVNFIPISTGMSGNVSVTYKITDSFGGSPSNAATITVSVNPGPLAADDIATANRNHSITFSITSNDTPVNASITLSLNSIDLDPVTAGKQTTKTIAGQGTFKANNDGTVTFTPVANFSGTVTPVSYTIQDNAGATSNPATISVTVTAVNDSPVAVNDVLTVNEDTPVTASVTANDTDADGNATIDKSSIDLDPVTAGKQTTKTITGQGTFKTNNDGTVTFTPVANFSGAVTPISYTIQDNAGATSNPATISVTITAVNDSPVAVNDLLTVNEDTPVTASVTANDTDADGNATIDKSSIDLDPVTAGKQTTKTIAGQGTFKANNDGTVTFTPVANFSGTVTPISYTIQDNAGATSNPATISVTITAVNDSPVAVNDLLTVNEDTPVTASVTANDTDADGNATIDKSSIDLDPVTAGKQTTKTIAGQGTFKANNDGTVTFTPVANFSGTVTPISYTIQDNAGATSNPATISVTITAVNDSPVAVNDLLTVNEDTPVTASVTANDTDADGNATIDKSSIDLDPVTAGKQTTKTITGQGTFKTNNDGTVTFTPVANFSGAVTPISYTIQDNAGLTSNPATISVTVTAVNESPVAVNDLLTVNEDTPVTASVTANDTDADGNATIDKSSIDLDPVTAGKQTTKTITGQGTFKTNNDGTVTFTPVANFSGAVTPISYTIQDNAGATSNPATISVTITAVNDSPVAVNDLLTVNEDTPVTASVTANDTDADGNATIDKSSIDLDPVTAGKQTTKTITGQGTFKANNDGTVTFTPVANFSGTVTPISYTIQDNAGLTSNPATISVTITAVNDSSVAVNDVLTVNEDTPVTASVTANDTDADGNATIDKSSIDLDPVIAGKQTTKTIAGQGTFKANNDGTVTFTPVANFNGAVTPVSYTIQDNAGATSNPATISVTVQHLNVMPIAVNDKIITYLNSPVNISLTENDSDNDGSINKSSVIIETNPLHGKVTVDPGTGIAVYSPENNYKGVDNFTYTVKDDKGAKSNTATVTITINTPFKVGLAKKLVSVNKTENNSYDILFIFTITNFSDHLLEKVALQDDLKKAFPGTEVIVSSLKATGTLKTNSSYDGKQNIDILLPGSSIAAGETATVELKVNVHLISQSGSFKNIAEIKAFSPISNQLISDLSTDGIKPDPETAGDISPATATEIILNSEEFIPTGFSPNSDGLNDRFVIDNPLSKRISLEIFNRWGNRVYKNVDYKNDWEGICTEGIHMGEDLPDGTYFYIVLIENGSKQVGQLTIKR